MCCKRIKIVSNPDDNNTYYMPLVLETAAMLPLPHFLFLTAYVQSLESGREK